MADLPGARLGRSARTNHLRRQRAARKAASTRTWPAATGGARVHHTDPTTGTTTVYQLEPEQEADDGDRR